MAKNRQPVLKRCKTLGLSPAVLGYSKETAATKADAPQTV